LRRSKFVDEFAEAEVPAIEVVVYIDNRNLRIARLLPQSCNVLRCFYGGGEKSFGSFEVHRVDDVDEQECDGRSSKRHGNLSG
jgi:hypothetical protein